MATPTADSYVADAGATVSAGRSLSSSGLDYVLDLLEAAPAESWVQLNADTNTFGSVGPPNDLRANYGGIPAPTEPIQGVWPSFAWDPIDHRIILWGGGHANTSANEVYEWRCDTREWHLSFHASEMVQVNSFPTFRSAGFNDAPVSSHTYGSNAFLTQQRRFWTFGGAAHGTGNTLAVYDPSSGAVLRSAGGYSASMALARQGRVAGAYGTNNKRGSYAGVNLDGADAWRLHDWFGKPSGSPVFGGAAYNKHIECGAAATVEGGKDVLYYTAASGTSPALLRVEFVDSNPLNDLHALVGSTDGQPTGGVGSTGQGILALSATAGLVVRLMGGNNSGHYLRFCDLKRTWGFSNGWRTPTLTGPDTAEFYALELHRAGLVWNPVKGCFTVWNLGRQVWEIAVPAGNPTPDTGWTLTKVAMNTATPAPRSAYQANESGILGKFRWADDLRAAVTTFGNYSGEVWAYKPAGWTRG